MTSEHRPLKTLKRVISKAGLGSRTEARRWIHAGIRIDRLPIGRWRHLTAAEVEQLAQASLPAADGLRLVK